jgi:hypothetical protein
MPQCLYPSAPHGRRTLAPAAACRGRRSAARAGLPQTPVLLLTGPSWPSEARAIRHRTPGRCAAASYSRWETRVSGTAYNPKRVESWVIFVYDPMVSTGVSLVEKQNRSGS